MIRFEEDLKAIQKCTDQELTLWFRSLAEIIIKKSNPSYIQEFEIRQQSLYDIIFADGMIYQLYHRIQPKTLQNFVTILDILQVLTPRASDDLSFYTAITHLTTLHNVNTYLLPAQFQLILQDQTVCQNNLHFQQIARIFNDNIHQNGFKVNAQLLFWINLLNTAVNFKEKHSNSKSINQDLLLNFQSKLKRKIASEDLMLDYLTYNPYIMLIKNILNYHCSELLNSIHNRYVREEKKYQMFMTLQKMIILLQEYSIYQCIFSMDSKGLNLRPDQLKILQRLKKFEITNTNVMMIYLTILFNSMYGFQLETYFQQINQIYDQKQNNWSSKQIAIGQRSFFFETGRYPQQTPYSQALFKFFQYLTKNYEVEKQIVQLQLLPIISTYVLYLRWPACTYEIGLFQYSQLYDQAITHFLSQHSKVTRDIILSKQQTFFSAIQQLTYLYKKIIRDVLQLWKRNNYLYQLKLIRSFPLQNEPNFESKFNSTIMTYHHKELEQHRLGIEQHIRFNYPFFTYLLNQFLTQISKIPQFSEDDIQGIIHLISFMYSQEENSLFDGQIKLNNMQQVPSFQELRTFCEKFHLAKESEYFVFDNQRVAMQIVSLLINYNNPQINQCREFLSRAFKLDVDRQLIQNRMNESRISQISFETNRTSRIFVPKRNTPTWKVPLKENEFILLYYMTYGISYLLDIVLIKEKTPYPQTSWPRKYAQWDNFLALIAVILIGILLYLILN